MTQQQLALPGFQAGYEQGRADERVAIVAWLHDQMPPKVCDCVNGDLNLDWAADRIERGEHLKSTAPAESQGGAGRGAAGV